MKPTMKFSEMLKRLGQMRSQHNPNESGKPVISFRDDRLSKRNAEALSMAMEIIENAATEALLPPPKQDISSINILQTDLSKVEARVFAGLEKSEQVGGVFFIPGGVQPEDLKPSKEAEAELRARYLYARTQTARVASTSGETRRVPVTNRNGVYETPSDWFVVYDGPQVFIIGGKFKLAFPSSAGPTLSRLVSHHNDERRKHKGYTRALEARNKELATMNVELIHRNTRQRHALDTLRGEEFHGTERIRAKGKNARDPFTSRCTREHHCSSIFSGPCNGLPRV